MALERLPPCSKAPWLGNRSERQHPYSPGRNGWSRVRNGIIVSALTAGLITGLVVGTRGSGGGSSKWERVQHFPGLPETGTTCPQ